MDDEAISPRVQLILGLLKDRSPAALQAINDLTRGLVAGVLALDSEAAGDLYLLIQSRMEAGWAADYGPKRADAQEREEYYADLTFTVYRKLLEGKLSRFDPTKPFLPWLKVVVEHQAIDLWRRRKRQREIPLDVAAERGGPAEAFVDDAEDVDEIETRFDLKRIVGRVSGRTQAIIASLLANDCNIQATAAEFELTPQRIGQILRALRPPD